MWLRKEEWMPAKARAPDVAGFLILAGDQKMNFVDGSEE